MSVIVHITSGTILEKGDVTLPTRDIERYNSDCDSLMREIGEVIIKDVAIPTKRGYYLLFFPSEVENILNLMTIQGKYPLVGAFFAIVYDKDLNFESYKKGESQISKDMRYMILAN